MPTAATSRIEAMGVLVAGLTRPSSADPGSILSRDSANVSRVATTMLASHAREDGQEDRYLQDSSGDGTEVALEDVDEGVLGLAEKIGQAVRDRDEESDDHEQACRDRHVVGPDHGVRGHGPGVLGLLGQVRGAFPPDEAVQGEQAASTNPYQRARRTSAGSTPGSGSRVVMEEEDGAEEQQGRRAYGPVISKKTPVLLTALTARMLTMLMIAATAIATAANSTMSPWVGDFQMSLANTVPARPPSRPCRP